MESNKQLSKEKACFSPKIFTTAPRSGKRKPNKKTLAADSIAKSMLSSIEVELGLDGLFSGEMVHLSFDCQSNLRDAFKRECKANGSSTCQELRRFMVSYVAASHTKKHAFGNTLSKIIDPKVSIGSLNFTQQVQSRPRRLLKVAESTPEGKPVPEGNFCEVGVCRGKAVPAVAFGVYSQDGKQYCLCALHSKAFAESNMWRVK